MNIVKYLDKKGQTVIQKVRHWPPRPDNKHPKRRHKKILPSVRMADTFAIKNGLVRKNKK